MFKFLFFTTLLIFPTYTKANDFTLNCNMTKYSNTTNEQVAKSWVNPSSKFVVNGNNATYYYSNNSLSGSAQDKGDKLKMYFSRTVKMRSGTSVKDVKADLIIDYFHKSQKIAADWRFVGYRDLGTVWGKCSKN